MEESIHQRSIRIESGLIAALEDRDVEVVSASLDAFQDTLVSLRSDIYLKEKSNEYDKATLDLSRDVAARVALLSQLLIDQQKESTTILSGLASDLDCIFASFDPSPPLSQSLSSPELPDPQSYETWDQPYIPRAYKWLLTHLHNPYPSNDVKVSISRSTKTPLDLITTWFMKVRRRIGWTALSRKHFSSSRSETLDAAYRALVQDDPKRPLESNIIFEFMELKVAAEGLYPGKYTESALARKLDAAVKDMDVGRKLVQSSYPSPDRSVQSSPEPPLLVGESHCRSEPVPNRKRRVLSSADSSDTENDILDTPRDRPTKRLRCVFFLPFYIDAKY
jgi:hypothetical protein